MRSMMSSANPIIWVGKLQLRNLLEHAFLAADLIGIEEGGTHDALAEGLKHPLLAKDFSMIHVYKKAVV